MNKINSRALRKDYLDFCKSQNIPLKEKEIINVINTSIKDAKKNYSLLTEPKTCSLELYTMIWVKRAISYFIAQKSIKPINLKSPPSSYQASANFHLLYPEELLKKYRDILFSASPEKRNKIWQELSLGLNLKEFEKRFIEMTKERNKFVKNKKYLSRLDMDLNRFKVLKKDYDKFITNIDNVINICNKKLKSYNTLPNWFYSEFNIPCYICKLPKFPFNTIEETFNKIISANKILNKFKDKIIIKLEEEQSQMLYKTKSDSFEIIVNKKNNIRHQTTDLIHELSHVLVYLNSFKKNTNPIDMGVYSREKEAIKIEGKILKSISLDLYEALFFNEILLLIHRTIFEIELHKEPEQDLGSLYASIFNKCYKKARQKLNYLYILDNNLIFKPFSSLPHTIAHVNLLLEIKK